MATFRAGGHEWQLRLTIGMVGRLRTEAGIELGKLLDAGKVAEGLIGDPFKLGEILWIMCRAEAEGRGLTTPDEFFELLGPEELQAAVLGVLAAVVDFFQPGRASETKGKLPGLMDKVNRAADAAMAAVVDAEVDATLKRLGGSSPASPASTPAG